MTIREYEPKDLLEVFHINKACHPRPQPNIGLLEQIHKGQMWVAVEGEKVIGFLLSTNKEGTYIYNVAVLPEFQHKGAATGLFNVCHKFYEGVSHIYLYVNASNPAQKLYFDLGYRVTSVKENFYSNKQHALVMVKTLNDIPA